MPPSGSGASVGLVGAWTVPQARPRLACSDRSRSRCPSKVFRFSYKLLPTLQEAEVVVNLGSSFRGIVLLSEVTLDE
jgi:hypothetical protein